MAEIPPYIDPDSRIAKAWNKPLSDVATVPAVHITPETAERHRIYALLLMSLVKEWWNGNKEGARGGEYPGRASQRREDGSYLGDRLGDRYIGHNIAALAVDAQGRVVDVDFNHNKIFNSSVQHAEARLIRRLFGLAAVQDSWDFSSGSRHYRTDLKETTIYTSLESCAQCSGIMALGLIPQVFYLQPDPGQYLVAQLMRNLSDSNVAQHVPASAFGLQYFDELAAGYSAFQVAANATPFFRPDVGQPRKDTNLTSFLCTDTALAIYTRGHDEFSTFVCSKQTRTYAPLNKETGIKAMTNEQVLLHARQFLDYGLKAAQRGTPHFN